MDEILVPGVVDVFPASCIFYSPGVPRIDLTISSISGSVPYSPTSTTLLGNEGKTDGIDSLKTGSTSLEQEPVDVVKSLVGDHLTDDMGDRTQGEEQGHGDHVPQSYQALVSTTGEPTEGPSASVQEEFSALTWDETPSSTRQPPGQC